MKQPESLSHRFGRNFKENIAWLRELWKNEDDERDKLARYYRWHFKELLLCILLAFLLTRVDKVQQFFAAFAIDIKAGEQELFLFTFIFGMNGLVIFWLCYVFWHKPAKVRWKWLRSLFGNKRREDFEEYYRKPGNAWRVAMVASLPLLLVNTTLSFSLLRDNVLKSREISAISRYLDHYSLWALFSCAVLYLLLGSLIRPKSNVPASKIEPAADSVAEYDELLQRLKKSFWFNLALLPCIALALTGVLWFYSFYPVEIRYFILLGFILVPPLAVAFFLNCFSECLIIEKQKKQLHDLLKVEEEYPTWFEKWYDRLMMASYYTGIAIFLLSNNKSITSQEWFSQWMFPIAMLLFVFIAYYQVLDWLVYNMASVRYYALLVALGLSLMWFGQRDHYRLKFRGEVPRSGSLPRASLETYFIAWAKDRFEMRGPSDTSTTVFLAAAEGGGSRSGAWTSAILTQLNTETKGRFQRQCFAISAVSGGAVGAAATLSLWDNAMKPGVSSEAMFVPAKRDAYIGRIFKRNYISTALAGIFFYDALQQIPILHLLYRGQNSRTDRHQDEEDNAVCTALGDMFGNQAHIQYNYLKRTNFLALYYDNDWTDSIAKPKTNLPLFFPNTCRVEDGRRGIVSPVLMDTAIAKASPKSPFNAAVVDIVGIGREKDPARSISLGEATSLSELFPFVNSTVFINENTGSFMDGGTYENLGLTTLYEIRVSLGHICKAPSPSLLAQAYPDTTTRQQFEAYLKAIQFKILLIYNSDNHGKESQAHYNNSWQLFDPFTALMQTPFGGHTDYMYHKTWTEFGRHNEVIDFPLLLQEDIKNATSDKIVMSRWLSKSEMDDILRRASERVAAKKHLLEQ